MILKYCIYNILLLTIICSHSQLKSIDQLIFSKRTQKQQSLHIQKVDSFNLNFTTNIRAFESIKVTTKMKVFFSLIVNNESIVSMNGQVLAKFQEGSLITSVRNSYVYVLTQVNETIEISSLVMKNNNSLQYELVTKIENCSNRATGFVLSGVPRIRPTFVVSYENDSLVKYSDKGVFSEQNDDIIGPIVSLVKNALNIFIITDTQVVVVDGIRTLDLANCSFTPGDKIHNFFLRNQQAYIHAGDHLFTYSIPKCQLIHTNPVPPNCSISQLGQYILIIKQTIVYYLNPLKQYSMGIINIKLKPESLIQTVRKNQYTTFILISSPQNNQLTIYEYIGNNQQPLQMKGFKLPIFIIVIGIVVYYAYKNKYQPNKQNPSQQSNQAKDIKNTLNQLDFDNMTEQQKSSIEKIINSTQFKELMKEQEKQQGNIKKQKYTKMDKQD